METLALTPNAAEPALRSPEAQPVLLTVDDEPSVLSALRRLFRPQGWKTLQATSGAAALELLQEQPVDLVISDMRMPEMDGAQLLERVRKAHPHTMRVLLTGYADINATVAAINRGEIHRYIAKPWDDQDLVLVVRDALDRQALERQNHALQLLTEQQNAALRDANQSLEQRVAARTAELQQLNGMLETSYEDLDRSFMLAVNVFTSLLELRESPGDASTRSQGHARRVAALARDTAERLGMRSHDARDVYLGALLHDVGKLAFPDRMLSRPVSAYSVDEMARYRQHPLDGETVLMPLTRLQAAARIVRQHHERPDGQGFPDGLQGEDIVLGARIVAACSDLDGLMHGTQAETSHPPQRARQILRGGRGTRYDARVVDALMAVLEAADAAQDQDKLIEARDLRPGMVLARDLLSPQGAVLLAAGHVFDDRLVRQVTAFAQRQNLRLSLHVRAATPTEGRPD
ncbi:MAG: HD domain-containing phosphohydrolase [Rubrivivax sp.]|nr:response regulator [Rubrivivax sp.]